MVRETRSSAKRKAEVAEPEPDAKQSLLQDTQTAPTKLPVRAKDDEVSDAGAAAEPSEPTDSSAKGNLKVFNDDDDDAGAATVKPLPEAPVEASRPQEPKEEAEEESDDDEAPEAVSTTQAASAIRKTTQAAQRAAQEQAASQKRKRQQRDALFKQQAEGRRKDDAAGAVGDSGEPTDDKGASAPGAVAVDGTAAGLSSLSGQTSAKKRPGKPHIPNLLPAEYLDSSSEDEDEDEDEDEAAPRRSKSRPEKKKRAVATVEKQLTRLDRGPKDQQVGSTVYRVAKAKSDERLPPKAAVRSRQRKNHLLGRNRTAVQPRAGFFVK